MIPGFATPDGTRGQDESSHGVSFNPLGRTGLSVSSVGFGCYRVTTGTRTHEEALRKALSSGINLIDTSANYTDGGSERLVGQVVGEMIACGELARDCLVVISKGGYIQGNNWARYRKNIENGEHAPEVVVLKEGLAHCIHPDFLDDQIGRSLDRLGLETIDGYLLHNPEYYLEWANQQGASIEAARDEYYQRIEKAFRHLEDEVAHGRIRFYGISSNTFPAPADGPEFTELNRIWKIAEAIDSKHHFHVIQLPLNLLEPGALVEQNQPDGKSVLDFVIEKKLGVLTNRPLNAFTPKRMVRLAGIEVRDRMDYKTIIGCIKDLAKSETRLWQKILPRMDSIPDGVRLRIKQQGCFAETLKHHWRSFGSYERWREAKDGIFLPRIQGVMDYLNSHAEADLELAEWMPSHEKTLNRAFRAVASIYADDAIALERKIIRMVDHADGKWAEPGSLSQKAVRAMTSTSGISTVLVGMRKKNYVSDVLASADPSLEKQNRNGSWQRLAEMSRDLFPG